MARLSNDSCSPLEMQPSLLRNRLRDGRKRLPVGAWLATTRYQASGTMHCCRETHSGCELAELLMVNKCEPTINLVMYPRRNALKRLSKGKRARRWYSCLAISPFVDPSGNSGYLKEALNVNHSGHGKPVGSHARKLCGIPDVRTGEGPAGIGWWRKRMLFCNRTDRAVDETGIPNTQVCRLPPGLDEEMALSRLVTVAHRDVIRGVHDGRNVGYITTRVMSWTMDDAIELTGGLDENPGQAVERAGSSDLGRETGRMGWLDCHRDSHFPRGKWPGQHIRRHGYRCRLECFSGPSIWEVATLIGERIHGDMTWSSRLEPCARKRASTVPRGGRLATA
jgi:hypothetical protein